MLVCGPDRDGASWDAAAWRLPGLPSVSWNSRHRSSSVLLFLSSCHLTSRLPSGSGVANDCLSQRRLALSRLFSGPVDPPLASSPGGSSASCRSLLQPLRELLPLEADPISFLSHVVEVLHGLFPSVGGALQALTRSSPARLQENLFGGKFLRNAVVFNFSGAVGARGALGLDQLSSQNTSASLQKNKDLVQSVSRALQDAAFLSSLQHALKGTSDSHSDSLLQVRHDEADSTHLKINRSFTSDVRNRHHMNASPSSHNDLFFFSDTLMAGS